jgi:hypothetical protein
MNEKIKKLIADTRWVDELSEEENEVLEKGHKFDAEMKAAKHNKFKVGILDGTGIKE